MRKLLDFMRDVAEDNRIPLQNRIVIGGLLVYLMTPIDIVPDFIPILGWLDDAFITILIMDYIFNSADTDLILEHYPWNKQHFQKMKTYADRLSWLVPDRLKRTLFRHASQLSITKKTAEQIEKKSS